MKEHENPYWNEHNRPEDKDPMTAGQYDYKTGHKHAMSDHGFNPPRRAFRDSYTKGYHEGLKESNGNR